MLLSLTMDMLADEISHSKNRLYLSAAGIGAQLSNVLVKLKREYVNLDMAVLVDASAHSRRLGYGNHESLIKLKQADIPLYELPGARLSFCVADQKAWVFSMVPELVEDPVAPQGFNCVEVIETVAEQLAYTVKQLVNDASSINNQQSTEDDTKKLVIAPSVKATVLQDIRLNEVTEALEKNPPQKFDVSRQLLVFNSRIEFVELELAGGHIERHVFKFPSEIKQLLTGDPETQKRLSASYKMIGEDSKVSSKPITQEVERLRKAFLKPMGKLGRVILRSKKEEFLNQVNKLEKRIEKYSEELHKNLEQELNKSKKELVKAVVDRVKANPPDELKYGVEGNRVTKKDAQDYLNYLIDKHMPTAESLIGAIKLRCDFKSVTHEMLSDGEFQEQLKRQFRYVNWDKPMEEFMAVKSSEQQDFFS